MKYEIYINDKCVKSADTIVPIINYLMDNRFDERSSRTFKFKPGFGFNLYLRVLEDAEKDTET